MPFLSFILEARIGREVRTYLDRREADSGRIRRAASAEPDAATSTADTVEAQQ